MNATENHKPDQPLAVPLSDRLGLVAYLRNPARQPPLGDSMLMLAAAELERGLSIRVKRELFRFHSQQEWVNKGKSWYANCGVRQGFYLTVDAAGHVVHMGKCFMEATAQGLYPITVYELQTNWASGA